MKRLALVLFLCLAVPSLSAGTNQQDILKEKIQLIQADKQRLQQEFKILNVLEMKYMRELKDLEKKEDNKNKKDVKKEGR